MPPTKPEGKLGPYQCPMCPKSFDVDKALHGHMRIHNRPASNEPTIGDKRKFEETYSSTSNGPASAKRKMMECSSSSCSSSGSDSGSDSESRSGSDSDSDSDENEYSEEDVEPENFRTRYNDINNFRNKLDEFYETWTTEDYYNGNGTDYHLRYYTSLDLNECDESFVSYVKNLIATEEMNFAHSKTGTNPTPPMSADDDSASNSVSTDGADDDVSDGTDDNDPAGNSVSTDGADDDVSDGTDDNDPAGNSVSTDGAEDDDPTDNSVSDGTDDDDPAGNSMSDGADDSCESEAKEIHEQKKLSEIIRRNSTGAADVKKEYKCSMCDKRFGSHQALGGHQTKHRGERSLARSTMAAEEPIVKEHKCGDCGKDFPTGQALGGHRRLHYKGPLPHMKNKKNTKGGKDTLMELCEGNVHEANVGVFVKVEPEEIYKVEYGVHSELEEGEIPENYDDGHEYEEGEIRPDDDVGEKCKKLRIIPPPAKCTKVVKLEQVKDVEDGTWHQNLLNLNMMSRFQSEAQNKIAMPTNQTQEDPFDTHDQEGEKQDAMVTSLPDEEEPKSNPTLTRSLPSPPEPGADA